MAPKYFEAFQGITKDCALKYLSKVCGAVGNRVRGEYGVELGDVEDAQKVATIVYVMKNGYESDTSRITVEPIRMAFPQHAGPVDVKAYKKAYKAMAKFLSRRCRIKDKNQTQRLEVAVRSFLKGKTSELEARTATG